MTKKEWLKRGRYISKVLNSLEKSYSATNDVNIRRAIDRKRNRLRKVHEEIFEAIERENDGRYYTVLFERYIEMKTWNSIARDNNYSRSHVLRLHGEALKRIDITKKY